MTAKKEDYERVFNKLFGTSIKWSKLSLEELMELSIILRHPEMLFEKLGVEFKQDMGKKRLVELGSDWLEERIQEVEWNGPFINMARKALGIERKKKKEGEKTEEGQVASEV